MIFILLIPSLQICVINSIVGQDPKYMAFGIVNHEIDQANVTAEMPCPFGKGCLEGGAACKYISTLPEEKIVLVGKIFLVLCHLAN